MAAIPNNNYTFSIDYESQMFYEPLIVSKNKHDSDVGSMKGRLLSLMTGAYLVASYPYRLAAKVATAVANLFRTIAELILAAVSLGTHGEPVQMFKNAFQALGSAVISPVTNVVALVRCAVGTLFYPGAAVG